MALPTLLAYNYEAAEIGLLVACKDPSAVQRYSELHKQLLADDNVTKQFFAECIAKCGALITIGAYIRTVAPR
jgi:hypothetical protein